MRGQLSHELEVNVAAKEAWDLYGTIKLAKLAEKEFQLIDRIEIVEGDGGVGTLLKLILVPGTPGFASYSEKYTKVDCEKLIKETEVVEGGYLEIGFTLYRVRFEVIEKGSDSCIIKSTIEYELKEEAAANASIVSIQPLADSRNFKKLSHQQQGLRCSLVFKFCTLLCFLDSILDQLQTE